MLSPRSGQQTEVETPVALHQNTGRYVQDGDFNYETAGWRLRTGVWK
jgi:hypothetical protein